MINLKLHKILKYYQIKYFPHFNGEFKRPSLTDLRNHFFVVKEYTRRLFPLSSGQDLMMEILRNRGQLSEIVGMHRIKTWFSDVCLVILSNSEGLELTWWWRREKVERTPQRYVLVTSCLGLYYLYCRELFTKVKNKNFLQIKNNF